LSQIKTINPATEEVIKEYEVITQGELNNTVNKARNAFQEWLC
jgi:succinate-semialdehyde dehydrogenase/glutarate-semialdehyde dehydrogenase/succinyl-CoA reductase